MKGKILGYDAEAGMVVLRGEDGNRYAFPLTDWRDRRSPRKGDEVDFEADGRRARDVYTIAVGQPLDAASVAPLGVVAGWEPARFFLLRPVLSCAILVLIACFTGAYSIGDQRISLLEAPDLIGHMSVALDSLVAASGQDPAPRLGAGFTRVAFVLLLALYVVPLLAVLTIWRAFLGHRTDALARWTGIAAIVMPIGLPLIIVLMVQFWVLPGLPDPGVRLGRSGVSTPLQPFEALRLYATGTVLLIGAGAALWAAATGRLTVPLGIREGAETGAEPIKAEKRGRPDLFAPFRRRAPGSPQTAAPKSVSPAPEPRSPAAGTPAPASRQDPQSPPARAGTPDAVPSRSAPPQSPPVAPNRPAAANPDQRRTPPPAQAPIAAAPDTPAAPRARPSAPTGSPPVPEAAMVPAPAAPPAKPPKPAADPDHPGEEPALPAFLKVKDSTAAQAKAKPDAAQTDEPGVASHVTDLDLPTRKGSVWPEPVPAADAEPAAPAQAPRPDPEGAATRDGRGPKRTEP